MDRTARRGNRHIRTVYAQGYGAVATDPKNAYKRKSTGYRDFYV